MSGEWNERAMDGAGSPRVHPTNSIFIRLTAFMLTIGILPIFLISSMLRWHMEQMTERELNQSYQWLVSEHMGNVEDSLERYLSSMRYAARSSTILDALSNRKGNPYLLGGVISSELYKIMPLEAHREVRDCIVYSAGGVRTYGSSAAVFTASAERDWIARGWNGGEDWFADKMWNGRKLLTLIVPVQKVDVSAFTSRRLGLIRLDLYLDEQFAPAKGGDREYHVALLDKSGRLIYASNPELMPALEQWLAEEQPTQTAAGYTVIRQELNDYDMSLLYLFDVNELAAQKNALKQMIYPMAAIIALLIVLGAYWFSRHFSRRVNALVEKFRIAGTGDLSPTEPISGRDEIALLDHRFSEMLQKVDALNRKNNAQQLAIREAKYHNLQLQINPHFLYNTLETISAIGAVRGAFQVCDLCQRLGDIFRYSLGKDMGKYAAVADELRQTKNYIFIQQVRYHFEAFYSIEVDPDEVYMLRFLLQPIVENAVIHGLAKKNGTGTLEVCIGKRDGDLEIRISDDGVGSSWKRCAAACARKPTSGKTIQTSAYGISARESGFLMENPMALRCRADRTRAAHSRCCFRWPRRE